MFNPNSKFTCIQVPATNSKFNQIQILASNSKFTKIQLSTYFHFKNLPRYKYSHDPHPIQNLPRYKY